MEGELVEKPFSITKIISNKIFIIAVVALYILFQIWAAYIGKTNTIKREKFCNEAAVVIMDIPNYIEWFRPIAYPKLKKDEQANIRAKEDMVLVLTRFADKDWQQLIAILPD